MMDEHRLNHSIGVARKMMKIGKKRGFSEDRLRELFFLGFNHDAGYEFGDNLSHGVIGAKVLKDAGYIYWREIFYHGKVQNEYKSEYLTILNQADMQINRYGQDVGYAGRLDDIQNVYGENSQVYKEARELIKRLINKNVERDSEEL